jgi:hypothetical protein
MGKIAEALRANLRSVAASDARALRANDQELKAATAGLEVVHAPLSGWVDRKGPAWKGNVQAADSGHAQAFVQRERHQGLFQTQEGRPMPSPE